jgi:diguanylate cyclase (GGDEF)-like protein
MLNQTQVSRSEDELRYEPITTDRDSHHPSLMSGAIVEMERIVEISELSSHILIVDDSAENLRILSEILTQQGYQVRSALSGQAALSEVVSYPPRLILIDIIMADMNGYEVCQCLKSNPRTSTIPVVFLSALDETIDRIRAFEVGGVDYISKPYHPEEVLIRVETQLKLQAAQAQLQHINLHLESQIQLRTAALEQANAKLEHRACHDTLTGLPNRSVFMTKMQRLLHPRGEILPAECLLDPVPATTFALLFIDCDGFKILNDSLGHLVGDQFLIAMTQRLRQRLDPDQLLIRLGGDEFLVLAESIDRIDEAITIAERVLSIYEEPFQVEDHEIFLNASIGIVINHPQYQRPEDVLRDADAAMYRAKSSGKGTYSVFQPQLHAEALNRLTLENTLRRAIEKEELVLHYQPIIELKTGKLSGFEALLRWNHPQFGLLSPDRFIAIAEETGLIVPIGAWVLETAWLQLEAWKIDDRFRTLTMSVNVSVKQLYHPQFVHQIDGLIERGYDPTGLALEITESMMMYDAKTAKRVLTEISDRSIKISIDDFGQGYSSLSYLNELPIHTLKIDRAFVNQEGNSQIYRPEIVKAITNLAHSLGFSVIAEGVNHTTQLEDLRALNCEFGQGYFFSRPLDWGIATVLLGCDRHW